MSSYLSISNFIYFFNPCPISVPFSQPNFFHFIINRSRYSPWSATHLRDQPSMFQQLSTRVYMCPLSFHIDHVALPFLSVSPTWPNCLYISVRSFILCHDHLFFFSTFCFQCLLCSCYWPLFPFLLLVPSFCCSAFVHLCFRTSLSLSNQATELISSW